VQQLIPEDRVAEVMSNLFGAASLFSASLVAWGEKKAVELEPLVKRIAGLVALAPVHRGIG